MKKLEILNMIFIIKKVDSKEEYHNWINTNKKIFYPDKFTKSIAYDEIHPEIYLIHSF